MKIIDAIKKEGKPFIIPESSRNDLPLFFKEMGYKIGAEIGTHRGEFTEKFCKEGLEIYAIDPWISFPGQGRTQQVQYIQDGYYEDAKKRYVLLPRTLYWKEKYKNFDNVWAQHVDKWIKTEEDKKMLNDDFRDRENKIKEKEKFEKGMEKLIVVKKIKPVEDSQKPEDTEIIETQKIKETEEITANL